MLSTSIVAFPLPLWHAVLLLLPTLATALAALAIARVDQPAPAWRLARWALAVALAGAIGSAAAVAAGSHGSGFGLRADALGSVMLLLVSFIGWVIVRYAQTYLQAEASERRAAGWLMAVLAAVTLVVSTNHLALLTAAWAASSLALHRLLTFFNDRPAAVLAAHKKWVCSRVADLSMLAATLLFATTFDSLHIDRILAAAASAPHLPAGAQAAVLLLAVAALLKCAQLPFHGWLIQVMEAPTPVSALLHAGVVNLGGFVLLRFAPLVTSVPAAQTLLVVVGAATAVLAALVMSTRISVKVMLAWSTCAQMGFMLLQCGLGAWPMALLHLVAHALYKAHAFLAAGGVVRRAQQAQLLPASAAPSGAARLVAAAAVLLVVAAGVAVTSALQPAWTLSPAQLVLSAIVALALVPLLLRRTDAPAQVAAGARSRLGATLKGGLVGGSAAGAVALAYLGLQHLFTLAGLPRAADVPAVLWIGVALAFALLFAGQTLVAAAASSARLQRSLQALYPWFYGGLFLDERFTRALLTVWPAPRPAARSPWPGMPADTGASHGAGPLINVGRKATP